ncbi:type IV pilin-like G/H family protein [Dolichospermum heterosporum]|uniref:Prepilin-type N-terminal cleavage/methylation domain-containing protein n=1 Tax=Dolichospermum heterosporum TAC447 TaxID=747523 RepID=A0ABY5LQL8_9CYAN|nr:type IV pilin-like G/H family protein [Dolichospermum heterosporum]UUO14257.1 prepilin-type N-terminal cleavage/methylation domain-containing protein [Dolichospermum heterosporum TAC447]
MKSNFQARLLAYLLPKHPNEAGYTLVELITVILIIGILSAISIPSILSRANSGRQAEAKLFVGSMNRSQQAYYVENDVFSSSVGTLGNGMKQQTEYYQYQISIDSTGKVATNNGMSSVVFLKSYVGVTQAQTVINSSGSNELVVTVLLCENPVPGIGTLQTATSGICPSGWTTLPK